MQGDQHKQHISGQFNAELDAIKQHLLEMGGLVEQQLSSAMNALLMRDSGEAEQVIARDRDINEMELQIDEECLRIIARRQPAASDLRLVLAVAKSTTDLERIGDEASKVARHALRLSELGPAASGASELRKLGQHVAAMLRDALDAFARLDVSRAVEVVIDDNSVDTECDAAMTALTKLMETDVAQIDGALQVMWALRGLERVGDHATNIAEHVVYLARGVDVRHMQHDELAALTAAESGGSAGARGDSP